MNDQAPVFPTFSPPPPQLPSLGTPDKEGQQESSVADFTAELFAAAKSMNASGQPPQSMPSLVELGDPTPAPPPASPIPSAGITLPPARPTVTRGSEAPKDGLPFSVFEDLLNFAVSQDASDIHAKPNGPVFMRTKRGLLPVEGSTWTSAQMRKFIEYTMTPAQIEEYRELKETDYAFRSKNGDRFRVNAHTAQGQPEAVLRLIKTEVRTLDDLNLPKQLKSLASLHDGLVLVSGATGSGKSSTLAAVLNEVNRTQAKRIITIENPVEIVHTDQRSLISQREVGDDTVSFHAALRSVLRQNPDIILIGEIRDKETADAALQAAQTGHLVFSTIHASTAEETIKRFAGLYPAEERANIKRALSYTMKSVVVQRLLKTADGKGRVAALEILFQNHRISQAILADAEEQEGESITKIISESKVNNMITMDQFLLDLVIQGKITPEVALVDATSPALLKRAMQQRQLLPTQE